MSSGETGSAPECLIFRSCRQSYLQLRSRFTCFCTCSNDSVFHQACDGLEDGNRDRVAELTICLGVRDGDDKRAFARLIEAHEARALLGREAARAVKLIEFMVEFKRV